MKHSKRYNTAYGMYDRQKRYDLDEAIKILKSYPASKFDETVEIHFNLASTPAKPISRSATRWFCPMERAKSRACWFLPKATRRMRPGKPVPITWDWMI